MGVSRVKVTNLTILADTPEDTGVAVMQYLVGFGLTLWHGVEEDLTFIYLMLTCPKGTPVDGALASFTSIQTIDAKATHLIKVADQVFYQDEMTELRKHIKSALRRLITLNESRNKLAHGIAKVEDGQAVFLPFFNTAHDYRRRSFDHYGPTPSTVLPTTRWDEAEVRRRVETLREGPEVTLDLIRDIAALFEDESSPLRTARRMTLDRGIPYDPKPPETPQLQGK